MPYMYMLRCSDRSYYVGSTRKELADRLWEHSTGLGAQYTGSRLPVELVYAEEFDNIGDAFGREKQVQGWSRKKREALIDTDWSRLRRLASRARKPSAG